ncbi:MAG: UvrD-helicase domain-containing protein [Hymenobacteraceae bacterium]|nr:UvrD-helicase domain-containing protein [Hymenobacteraceae bacterium]
MPQLTVYSASAGSGKTYTLTREYLRLALATPAADGFRAVLALTFTNDAAGEMKTRIVAKLRELVPDAETGAVGDPVFLADLTATLVDDGALAGLTTPEAQRREVSARAAATFRQLLYDYADFAVGTIDSFGQRVVSAFARDLDLPPGFEVEMDQNLILTEAVARVLDRVNRARTPEDATLTALLRAYAEERTADDKQINSLADDLVDFGKNLFNDTYLDALRQLTATERTLAWFGSADKAIRARIADIIANVELLCQTAIASIDDRGLTPQHFKGGSNGIHSYFAKGSAQLDRKTDSKTVQDTIANDDWYGGAAKKPADRTQVDEVSGLLRQLYGLLESARGEYLLLTAMQRHWLKLTLLGEIGREVTQLCRERGLVLIGEFNRRIAEVVLREPLPFIYERLGERHDHLLIDEFQDTSALQWHNLLPLVAESVGRGKRSLLVGDGKQAIYRWRGGELEQIVALYAGTPHRLLERVREPDARAILREHYDVFGFENAPSPLPDERRLVARTLRENYRSAAEIVTFNNDFFSAVRDAWAGEVPLLAALYEATFRQHTPDKLRTMPAGHVEVLLVPTDAPARAWNPRTGELAPDGALPEHAGGETLPQHELMLWRTLALVEQARADRFALGDIAILCRVNDDAREVARFLKRRGYAISSRDSLQLDFADAVNLVVAVLRVLHTPTDAPARAGVLLLLDRVVLAEIPNPARAARIGVLSRPADTSPDEFWAELTRLGFPTVAPAHLDALSLYEAAEHLFSAFTLLTTAAAEAEYLLRLLDLALSFSLRHGNNLGAFLTYWDAAGHALSINTPPTSANEAITITSIHRSKGLEYGVVIVPFAQWSLTPRSTALLWGDLGDFALPELARADGKPDLVLPPIAVVTHNQQLDATMLGPQYRAERARTFVEGLNMLYVAFTRPRNRLYVLVPAPGKPDSEPTALPRSLDQLLLRVLARLGATAEETSGGTRYVVRVGGPAPKAKPSTPPDELLLREAPTQPWAPRLRLRQRALDLLDFTAPDATRAAARERVNRLRAALRRLDSPAHRARLLARLQAEGAATAAEAADLDADLLAVLAHPQLAPLWAVAVAPPTEVLIAGMPAAPDPLPARVVEEPAVNRVTLLDFPFDATDPAARRTFAAYAERYRLLGFTDIRAWWFDLETQAVHEVI